MNITNGKIHTVSGDVIENGYIIVENGKIKEVGSMEGYPGGESYDAAGGFVYPGLIDAHCHIGMWEDGLGFEGADGNEETDPITPQLRAIDAVNPMDRAFEEALCAGVTTVVTGPGSANPISGQFAALKTSGKRIDKMIISPYVSMKMALGENPKSVYGEKERTPTTRMATAALIREALNEAKRYSYDLKKHEENPDENDKPDYDIKCESLLDVINKKVPVKFHAHRADDIFTALRLSKEFDIKVTLEHCTEGHLIAPELAAENVSAAVGPVLCDRSKPELKNQAEENAAVLHKNGVNVCIITDHPEVPVKYLALSASAAYHAGLPKAAALSAITLSAARHCGIEDRVGSIAAGKDADIIITRKDIIENPFEKPVLVMTDGRVADI